MTKKHRFNFIEYHKSQVNLYKALPIPIYPVQLL